MIIFWCVLFFFIIDYIQTGWIEWCLLAVQDAARSQKNNALCSGNDETGQKNLDGRLGGLICQYLSRLLQILQSKHGQAVSVFNSGRLCACVLFQLSRWPATTANTVWRASAWATPKRTAPPTPVSASPEKQVSNLPSHFTHRHTHTHPETHYKTNVSVIQSERSHPGQTKISASRLSNPYQSWFMTKACRLCLGSQK